MEGDRSSVLFGRHSALAIYRAIASMAKPDFTTGQLISLSGASGPDCSKELKRLLSLGLVTQASRRGEYQRQDAPYFWPWVAVMAEEWLDT